MWLPQLFIGPPSIKDVSVDTSVCSVLVRWSTNRNEICGPITFNVTLINESSILVNQSPKNLSNLVPDTNYTLEVCAMDGAGRGMAFTRIFKTAIPKGMSQFIVSTLYPLWLLHHVKAKCSLLHGIVLITPVESSSTGPLYVCWKSKMYFTTICCRQQRAALQLLIWEYTLLMPSLML